MSIDRAGGAVLYERIASSLRYKMISGQLPGGAPLPGEIDLAAEFGVSRHTIREALRMLADEGMIVRRTGRRTVVAAGVPGILAVVVGPGTRITARLPLADERAKVRPAPGEPVLVVEVPGKSPLMYPADRTVIVTTAGEPPSSLPGDGFL